MRLKSFNLLNALSMRQRSAACRYERLFSVAAIWNHRLGSALVQVFAQLGAIVGLVAEHPFRRLHSANEALCDLAIVRFTSGQQDGDKAPFNICECVNLRVAPSARAPNCLLLLPPFHPPPSGALSRAWSRSSACRWIVRSRQAPGTGFPRRRAAPSAHSGCRSLSEDHSRAGNRTSDSRSSARARCR
jgi:hypothetical protein